MTGQRTSENRKSAKSKPVVAEPARNQGVPIEETALPPISSSPTVQAQVDQLGDSGWQAAQRRAMAARIGRIQGNRHLQRLFGNRAEADRPLEGGVKSKMEAAFGKDFTGVRVHTDGGASAQAQAADAAAFTVGEDITFRAGEYQPGTVVGDALIAHELAHVAQQQGATAGTTPVQREMADAEQDALESDADSSMLRAVSSLWSGIQGTFKTIRRNAMPALRSGLRLQRCSDAQKKRAEAINKILETIPTGKEAIAIGKKYDVKLAESKEGSKYDPPSNTIYISSAEDDKEAALTFVHEMNHAKYAKEGKSADVEKLGKEEYVKKWVEEEAEGTVKSIEAKIELEGTKIDVSKTGFPLEAEYRKAFKDAVDAAKLKDPKKSEEDLKKIGREAGKARVTQGFMNGEVVGNISKKPYPDKYREYWDKVHAK